MRKAWEQSLFLCYLVFEGGALECWNVSLV